jgi:hypothetical protein
MHIHALWAMGCGPGIGKLIPLLLALALAAYLLTRKR